MPKTYMKTHSMWNMLEPLGKEDLKVFKLRDLLPKSIDLVFRLVGWTSAREEHEDVVIPWIQQSQGV